MFHIINWLNRLRSLNMSPHISTILQNICKRSTLLSKLTPNEAGFGDTHGDIVGLHVWLGSLIATFPLCPFLVLFFSLFASTSTIFINLLICMVLAHNFIFGCITYVHFDYIRVVCQFFIPFLSTGWTPLSGIFILVHLHAVLSIGGSILGSWTPYILIFISHQHLVAFCVFTLEHNGIWHSVLF